MNNSPFWEDGFFPDMQPKRQAFLLPRPWHGFLVLYQVVLILVPAAVLWFISPWFFLFYIVLMVSAYSLMIYRRRKFLSDQDRIRQVQNAARELTGAAKIGSAIHVAGHPALQREQPVVIVLIDARLVLYPYEKAVPLDEIPVSQIGSVQTVVYDDERVPHVDVIDSTAQALQFSFRRNGNDFSCLFRRMQNLRPIEWYHAIQQARLQSSAIH